MPDLVDSVSAILAQAAKRAEVAGENIANATTPAYKRRVSFATLLDPATPLPGSLPTMKQGVDFTAGKLVQSGNPLDLAITGPGFFALREDVPGAADAIRYSRAGRFTRRADGRLVDPQGGVLMQANGSDVVLAEGSFTIDPGGRINGATAEGTSIGVFFAVSPAGLAPVAGGFADRNAEMKPHTDAALVQGAYEASNVTTGEEMVALMQSMRMAESGQRVMMTYDDIMGRVISTFGESVR